MEMNESELDSVYTLLCKTMTELGEPRSPLFLARFALLAIDRIGDPELVQQLIADAGEGLNDGVSGTAPSRMQP